MKIFRRQEFQECSSCLQGWNFSEDDEDDLKKPEKPLKEDTELSDWNLVMKANDFAARRHRHQKRKDNATPYINHPIGVMYILTNEAKVYDPVTLAAAVLHDVVEDTKTTLEEIKAEFGEEVLRVVEQCTDDKTLAKAERKKLQIENYGKHEHRVSQQVRSTEQLVILGQTSPSRWQTL